MPGAKGKKAPGAKTLAQAKKNCHLAPLTGGGTHGHPVEDVIGEQRFLLPCSVAEGESQAIVTARARCRSA
jgi:hypothetical protein